MLEMEERDLIDISCTDGRGTLHKSMFLTLRNQSRAKYFKGQMFKNHARGIAVYSKIECLEEANKSGTDWNTEPYTLFVKNNRGDMADIKQAPFKALCSLAHSLDVFSEQVPAPKIMKFWTEPASIIIDDEPIVQVRFDRKPGTCTILVKDKHKAEFQQFFPGKLFWLTASRELKEKHESAENTTDQNDIEDEALHNFPFLIEWSNILDFGGDPLASLKSKMSSKGKGKNFDKGLREWQK